MCLFLSTAGGKSVNLHPDSHKPSVTNSKSAHQLSILPRPVSAAGDFLAGELAGLRGVLQVVLPGHHDVARVGVVAEKAVLMRGFFHL